MRQRSPIPSHLKFFASVQTEILYSRGRGYSLYCYDRSARRVFQVSKSAIWYFQVCSEKTRSYFRKSINFQGCKSKMSDFFRLTPTFFKIYGKRYFLGQNFLPRGYGRVFFHIFRQVPLSLSPRNIPPPGLYLTLYIILIVIAMAIVCYPATEHFQQFVECFIKKRVKEIKFQSFRFCSV